MAMLAEPKRKQKFSVNPRGTTWSNDESKFGQKLMEKMGWSKGKGLGSKLHGNTEHVGVSLKTDKIGLGCSKSQADNWIAHQDDFNDLLASLNQGHRASEPEMKVSSLEQTSKTSKGRLHYQKFAKGKDLSLRSEMDLDCVFGKRKSQSGNNTPQTQSEPNSDSEEQREPTGGLQTVTSTDSIQDYFRRKMAERKLKLKSGGGGDSSNSLVDMGDTGANSAGSSIDAEQLGYTGDKIGQCDTNENDRPVFGLGFSDTAGDNGNEDLEQKSGESEVNGKSVTTEDNGEGKKKKKKKKSKKRMLENDKTENSDQSVVKEESASDNAYVNDVEIGKNKTKKQKKMESTGRDTENNDISENVVEETSVKKKSKRKKRKVQESEEISIECENDFRQDFGQNEENNLINQDEALVGLDAVNNIKKGKKPKKRVSFMLDDGTEGNGDDVVPKKKKKLDENHEGHDVIDHSAHIEQSNAEITEVGGVNLEDTPDQGDEPAKSVTTPKKRKTKNTLTLGQALKKVGRGDFGQIRAQARKIEGRAKTNTDKKLNEKTDKKLKKKTDKKLKKKTDKKLKRKSDTEKKLKEKEKTLDEKGHKLDSKKSQGNVEKSNMQQINVQSSRLVTRDNISLEGIFPGTNLDSLSGYKGVDDTVANKIARETLKSCNDIKRSLAKRRSNLGGGRIFKRQNNNQRKWTGQQNFGGCRNFKRQNNKERGSGRVRGNKNNRY